MKELQTAVPWGSPFEPEVPGFNDQWWQRNRGLTQRSTMCLYSFMYDSEEVARAEVLVPPHKLEARYIGLDSPCLAVEISFFEVRAEYRRRGFGRESVQLITETFPEELLFAFSEQADHFWGGIGWKHHRRADEGFSRFRPLFVLDQRI